MTVKKKLEKGIFQRIQASILPVLLKAFVTMRTSRSCSFILNLFIILDSVECRTLPSTQASRLNDYQSYFKNEKIKTLRIVNKSHMQNGLLMLRNLRKHATFFKVVF